MQNRTFADFAPQLESFREKLKWLAAELLVLTNEAAAIGRHEGKFFTYDYDGMCMKVSATPVDALSQVHFLLETSMDSLLFFLADPHGKEYKDTPPPSEEEIVERIGEQDQD